jgi:glycosyltransferase involved in cell wall biosynthesis
MGSSFLNTSATTPLLRRPVSRQVRLAYLVSHPIQYQAPLLRRIAQDPNIDLTVFFGSDFSVRGYQDKGFGVEVKWDVPLLEGYKSRFLPALRDNGTASVFSPISLGLTRLLAGHGEEPGFDVLWVHGYSTVNTMKAMLAAKAVGVPVLLRAESWLHDRPRTGAKLLAKKIYFALLRNLVDAVLAIGTHNREYWKHYFGGDFPIFLMPYSVDNAYFRRLSLEAASGRDALRAELDLEPGRPVILFASKLQTRKHCGDLVEAYARLSPGAGQEPHPYLVIVGDGEERAALERQAAATGFKSIRFCGFRNQSEMPRFFDLCAVFVLPSRHEPWGLIVNEAMNAARAIVVSDDVGCQVDLVTDGIEGCVYPVRDVGALAEALARVLATPETAAEMGRRALARINEWTFEEDVKGLRQAITHVSRKLSGEERDWSAESAAARPGGTQLDEVR